MRYLLAALVALVLLPATAHADVAESLRIADATWGPHPCAGKVQVTFDPTLYDRGRAGEAIGVTLDGLGWFVASCRIAVAPGMSPTDECNTIAHEVGHLVLGPGHEGRMADVAPLACDYSPSGRVRSKLPAPRAAWAVSCVLDTATGKQMCAARSKGAKTRRYVVTAQAVKRLARHR